MKNSPFYIFACACLVLGGFLAGMFVGRNLSGATIQTSVLSDTPTVSEQPTESTNPTEGSAPKSRININTADRDTLMQLPGIGPELAQAIIDYRAMKGSFKDITELKNVYGIGETHFQKIWYMITVGG